ncbi:MAG: helical backbone metal receptor [Acidimicrobiales bacterium]
MTAEGTRPGPRVVSLVPSVTETLVAWGIVPVGVTRFCEQPELFAVGGTKTPDLDVIAELDPDLVVVNDEENRSEDAAELEARGIAVHACSPRSVAEVAPRLARRRRRRPRIGSRCAGGGSPTPSTPRADAPARGAGVRADLAAALDDDLRRHLRVVAARRSASRTCSPSRTVSGSTATGTPPSRGTRSRCRGQTWCSPTEPYDFKPFHLEVLREVAPVVAIDGQDLFWWGCGRRSPPSGCAQILAGIGR